MISGYTEDHLIESPAVQPVQHDLGWGVVNCYGEWDGGKSDLGRVGKRVELVSVVEWEAESWSLLVFLSVPLWPLRPSGELLE